MQETILAVDPGTQCGWAIKNLSTHAYLSGVWNLKGGRYEGGGMRYVHLKRHLNEIRQACTVTQVAFEEVRRHLGTDAAHVYGGIIATLTAWCEEFQVPYTAIPVGTVKKTATGKGNADKKAMLAAAKDRWPGHNFLNDNEADARFIAEAALSSNGH